MEGDMGNDQQPLVVSEAPKLDLDLYIQNYKGRTRFDRLLLIGRTCVPLRTDALKGAVAEAKRGRDLYRYEQATNALIQAAPAEPEAQMDNEWIKNTQRHNAADSQRLKDQLNMYKHNLIKESIKMGLEELGTHFESTGDLVGALDMYSRMRANVSTTRHILETGRLVTRIHLQNKDWSTALSTASKLLSQAEDEFHYNQWLRVVQGICELNTLNYCQAASHFLNVMWSSNPVYTDIASSNDIATYGGLLALANMDRNQLQRRLLDDQNFRGFLELEPHIRRAISMFINSRFSACLEILDGYKPDWLLDIYLQPHIKTIFSLIRRKCIIQYLIPFSCITLDTMNKQFGQEGDSIEQEVATMIKSGELKARINSVGRVIIKEKFEARAAMQKHGLKAVDEFEKLVLERIRIMSLRAADMEIKGLKKGSLPVPPLQNIHDKLVDNRGTEEAVGPC